MGRRRVTKPKKQAALSAENDLNIMKEPKIEEQDDQFTDPDGVNSVSALMNLCVERQSVAIRAIRGVEIEHLLTEIRLIRSYFNEEQLQKNALKFFAENFPNMSVVKCGVNGQSELQWKTDKDKVHLDNRKDVHASLLHRLSIACSDCSAPFSSLAKTRLVDIVDLQIRDFVLEEPSETQMPGMQDPFQTPGISSQRLSIGITPKTLRVPKPGEMLLSIRGSPLGVYK